MDRRVAKYAGWLQDLYDRPYFIPLIEKWKPIIVSRLANAFRKR